MTSWSNTITPLHTLQKVINSIYIYIYIYIYMYVFSNIGEKWWRYTVYSTMCPNSKSFLVRIFLYSARKTQIQNSVFGHFSRSVDLSISYKTRINFKTSELSDLWFKTSWFSVLKSAIRVLQALIFILRPSLSVSKFTSKLVSVTYI